MKRCKIILQDMLMVWEVGELSRRKRRAGKKKEQRQLEEYYRFQHLNTRNKKITGLSENIVHIRPNIGVFKPPYAKSKKKPGTAIYPEFKSCVGDGNS